MLVWDTAGEGGRVLVLLEDIHGLMNPHCLTCRIGLDWNELVHTLPAGA